MTNYLKEANKANTKVWSYEPRVSVHCLKITMLSILGSYRTEFENGISAVTELLNKQRLFFSIICMLHLELYSEIMLVPQFIT